MTQVLKLTYIVDNESMTDEEFENQEEREFFVTSEMLVRLIENNDMNLNPDDEINWNYVSIEKL